MQHEFIKARKYDNVYRYATSLVPDLGERSDVLKEIIWSGAVQHGKVKERVIKDAWTGSAQLEASDAELINRYYAQRITYAEAIDMPHLIPRFEAERNKALAWLSKPRNE